MTAFIGTNTISPQLLSDEFALTIALVVFVMLTAVLLTLLIALIASKNFRKVFFHDKPKKADKKSRAADKSAETAANAQDASAESAPEYFEGVLTVPIGAIPEKRSSKKTKVDEEPEIYNKIPTVAIPEVDNKQSKVYTVRNTSSVRAKTAATPSPTSTAKSKQAASAKTATAVKDKKPTSTGTSKKR